MSERKDWNEREAMIAEGSEGPLDAEAASEMELLASLLADPSTWAEPPADLEDAVVRAVTEAAPDRVPETAGSPLPPVLPGAGSVIGARRRPSRRARWTAIAAATAVAASVVIGAGIVVNGGGDHPEFVAQMRATALAPGARGTAGVTRNAAGFHVTLDAHDLPHLATGEYFQAWLKNAAGTSVPIGTFSSSDHRVTLWSGVSPESFPTITVTIEKTDGNQASSGLVVLAGPVHHR